MAAKRFTLRWCSSKVTIFASYEAGYMNQTTPLLGISLLSGKRTPLAIVLVPIAILAKSSVLQSSRSRQLSGSVDPHEERPGIVRVPRIRAILH